MTLTGENRSIWRETSRSSSLPTKIPTWNDEGSSPSLGGESPANNRLSLEPWQGLLFISRCSCYPLLLSSYICFLDLSCMCVASVLFNFVSSSFWLVYKRTVRKARPPVCTHCIHHLRWTVRTRCKQRGNRLLSSLRRPCRLWDPPGHLLKECRWFFP